MALAPWQVLAAGKFRTDEEEEQHLQSGEKGHTAFSAEWKRNEKERAVSAALEKVAKEVGAKLITAVAIAYVMQRAPYVFPIIGGRKVEHLQANLEALEIALTPEHIKYLESILAFESGFPTTMIGNGSEYSYLLKNVGYMEKQPPLRPILPDILPDNSCEIRNEFGRR